MLRKKNRDIVNQVEFVSIETLVPEDHILRASLDPVVYHRQLRKVTKSKSIFPNDEALLKKLYLATKDVTRKWTTRIQNWGTILAQFSIYFEERLAGYLK